MSETKVAFAGRTIRSLKNIFFRYMEDNGYKYIHKTPHFIVTMSSRNNRSIDMEPNHVKDSDFMSIFYSKTLREYKKPKFGIGDRVRISKYELPFRKKYKPQFLPEKCLKMLPLLQKTSKLYNQRRTRRSYTWEILREGTN